MTLPGGALARLPRPSWAGDVDEALRAQFEAFVTELERGGNLGRPPAWSQQADALAQALHQASRRLGISRAHEYSDDVVWAAWASALLLFFAWGGQSPAYLQARARLPSTPRWQAALASLDALTPLAAQGVD